MFGPSPSQVKARGFDPRIRRFESCRPSHFRNYDGDLKHE